MPSPTAMKRDLAAFEDTTFDLLVVGGGVVGACVARDAAMRGLSTALVERDDFGGGASANCLKIVHGGLRYLQHLDFARMRESIRERSMWLGSAPHLVEPLRIVMPTQRGKFPPRSLMGAALAVNDAISADRNRGLLPDRRLRGGRVLSRRATLAEVPELANSPVTGGVQFHDALMHSPERLVLEVVEAASMAGAVVANHLELEGSLRVAGQLAGVRLRDRLTGGILEVRARRIVNASGAWTPEVAARLLGRPGAAVPGYSVAINFVTPGLGHDVAFTIAGGTPDPDRVMRSTNRQLFLVPWRGHTLIGTAHLPFEGDPARFRISEEQIERFRQEVITATPSIPLAREDIAVVHSGLLPVSDGSAGSGVRLLKRHRILSHADEGAPGIISVFSIKFTTARRLAEIIVDRVFRDDGRTPPPCRTAGTPLPGGNVANLDALRAEARRRYDGPSDVLEGLIRTYGGRYGQVLAYRDELSDWDARVVENAPVIRAQLLHAARTEMALTAEDLLCRRTELGPRGLITPAADRAARELLAMASVAPTGTLPRRDDG